MELFSSDHQTLLEQFCNKSSLFSACEFHERISDFETVLRNLGYGTTQLKSSSHILKALYLFLYRYGLGYHPEIAGIWFEEIRRTLGNSWKNWRRILRLFKQYTEEGIVLKGTRYTYRVDIPWYLPGMVPYSCKKLYGQVDPRIPESFHSKKL